MNKFLVRLSLAAGMTLALISIGSAANAQDQPNSQEPAATTPPQQQQPSTTTQDQSAAPSTPQDQETTSAPQQPAPENQTQMQAQGAKSFTGEVSKEDGKVVLKDPVTKMSYKLDDQEKAASFVGKQVKVTGKLDVDTMTVHVDSIELLS